MPVMVAVFSADGSILSINARLQQLLGLAEGTVPTPELLAESYSDPRERARFRALVEAADSGWEDFDTLTHDGRPTPTSWTVRRLPNGMRVGIGIENRGRRTAEEKLPASGSELRCLETANVIGIMPVDRGGRVLAANDEALRITGFTRDDIAAGRLDWAALSSPEYAEADRCAFEQVLATGACRPFRKEYVRTDGTRVPVTIGAALAEGPDGHVIAFIIDVSREQQADEVRARLADIVESSDDAIIGLSLEGVITSWNSGAERLYGYSAAAAIGQHIALVAPSHANWDIHQLTELAARGTRLRLSEAVHTRSDGIEIDVALSLSAVHDSRRRLAGASIIARDLTIRKRIERQLIDSHQQMRQLAARIESIREQERTRVAREIHDELGQMLTVLKMELETVRLSLSTRRRADAGDLPARLASMAQHAQSSIESVKRIASELRPGILDHLGLTAALEWQAGEFQRRTGIRCEAGELAEVELDSERATAVFRIFQEVLTNIARHSGATAATIQLRTEGDLLLLAVHDNGRGIDPGAVKNPRSLGLLGMRERAMLIGGTLSISGEPGAGTTVRLWTPLAAGTPSGTGDPALAAGTIRRERARARILIADDHTMFRQGLKELLAARFADAQFAEAADGDAALEAIARESWDLVILDISMPGKSGLAVLDEIRRTSSNVPVVVLSTYAEEPYRASVLRRGAKAYISKSSTSAGLVSAIEAVLSQGGSGGGKPACRPSESKE